MLNFLYCFDNGYNIQAQCSIYSLHENVDEKINQFKNALEESKKFYKDEVREVYLNRIKNR